MWTSLLPPLPPEDLPGTLSVAFSFASVVLFIVLSFTFG